MQNCWICGKAVDDKSDIYDYGERTPRFYCQECMEEVTEQYKLDMKEYIRLKKKLMLERAVRMMEKQPLNIYDYQEAIQAVGEFVAEHPDKFDSSHEMVAAIILIDNEIPCELQHKIGNYQCDFYIPSMKVILEIDGERHKHKVGYDSVRDEAIIKELGSGWNIVRIKTDYMEQNAELLVEAIKTVLAERKKAKEKRKAFKELYK